MKYIEVKGKNIEDAVEIGLKELGVSRDKVSIEILSKHKPSFLSLFGMKSKAVSIKMSLKEQSLDYNAVLRVIEKNISKMFTFANLNLNSKIEIKDENIFVEINGEDANLLIGKSGDVLEAFENILTLIVNKEEKAKINISVDIDSYKKVKSEKVKSLTFDIAKKVLESGEDYKMKQLRAYERRIVHSVIDSLEDVYSFSVGYGNSRYIIVTKNKPKKMVYKN